MKMKPKHFAHLKKSITNLINNDWKKWIERYEAGNIPRAERVQDLQRRFCFDIWYAADLCKFAVDNLYSYLNDDHIYTALKSICPKVIKRY